MKYMKKCEDCGKPVKSIRHRLCDGCARARERERNRRYKQVSERDKSLKLALAEQREVNRMNNAKFIPRRHAQIMTDAEQKEIERRCADGLLRTDIMSREAYHVVHRAAWLWRSA